MGAVLSNPEITALLIQFVLGGIASFFAILSWTYTRNLYWLLAIAGILSIYASILYRALRLFGLITGPELLVLGTPLGTLVSDNLSIVFFIAASIAYIRSNR
jgi:hypothetical protein